MINTVKEMLSRDTDMQSMVRCQCVNDIMEGGKEWALKEGRGRNWGRGGEGTGGGVGAGEGDGQGN